MKQNIIIPNILFLVGATSCSKEETTLNEPKITESTNLEGQNIIMILKKAIFLLLFTFLTFTSCKKNEVSNVDSNLYFPQVKAIIQAKCLSCHSLVTGTGQGRPVIFDSDAQIADVYAASIKTSVETKRMPLEDTLSQTNIDLVVKWYKKGGKLTD